MAEYFAHSLESLGGTPLPVSEWELLYTGSGRGHLERVAARAAEFAGRFGAAEWGRVVGLWHDIGKYSAEFQAYLMKENGFEAHLEQYAGRVDHSTAGAFHAVQSFGSRSLTEYGRLLAFCIAGHHAGLPDSTASSGESGLDQRLKKPVRDYSAAPVALLEAPSLPPPPLSLGHDDARRAAFQIGLFCRMLFSCLVDADFLETEAFSTPDRSALRNGGGTYLRDLAGMLDAYLEQLALASIQNNVFECRKEVLEACRIAATLRPGLYSLTVPTGGGKTLSSLAFALRHAVAHDLERVIYAIPFTSIVEQTSKVFLDVFGTMGEDVVLEHHSNFDPERETKKSRLASENWAAPIVVTTNVQLFESLFASRTSRCRKLHRIARSVIILDEAQTLPVELLKPCLFVLRELVEDYGCTVVLCTATQPAVNRSEFFNIGLEGVREIIPEPKKLYRRMKRVDVEPVGRLKDEELTRRLAEHEQFLCIVNTRPHAFRIFESLSTEAFTGTRDGLFHLSTFMCGEHRSQVIEKIRRRLKEGRPCRVVSTQLIEAGVDIDFPVVFRALSGIDSIAQAAGRCNREGRLDTATVYLFEPDSVRLLGYLKSTADSAAELLPDTPDLLAPETIRRYFELHYWKHSDRWDGKGVLDCFPEPPARLAFRFRSAAERFRMIDERSIAVFVPWQDNGRRLIERLRYAGPVRELLRKLQRYSVSLYERDYIKMLGRDIELLQESYSVLVNTDCYDESVGLRIDRAGYHEPEALII